MRQYFDVSRIRETRTILLVLLVAGLTSCNIYPGKENRKHLMELKRGMNKQQIIDTMGLPNRNEAFANNNGGSIEIFFYNITDEWAMEEDTGNPFYDGSCRYSSNCVPLVIENGRLIGWGKEFYQEKLKIEHVSTHR